MKIVIGLGFALILVALVSAGVFMIRRPREGSGRNAQSRMAWALAVRVGVSVTVFLFVMLAYLMGWIQPTGVPVGH